MKLTSTRRKASLLMASLLAGSLALTACGADNGGGDGDADGYDPDEEITLTVSWWGNDERARMMDEVFDLFMERHENITIAAEPTGDPENLFTRLSTDFAAGGGPDLFTLGGALPQEYGGAGQLLDLSTVSEHVDLDVYEDFTTTNATVDDVLYGLPTGGNAIGLLVNHTLFDEAGVERLSENVGWDEFSEKAAQISANSDVVGLDLRIQDIIATYISQLNGIGLYDWDGNLAVTPEELATWYEKEVEWAESGAIADPSVVVEHHTVTPDMSLFGTREAALSFGYSNQLEAYTAALGDDEVTMVLPPTDTDNPGVAVLPSQFWSINANTENPEASAMLMDFLLNDTEAAELILANRGLQFNPEVLEHIEPMLDPASAIAATYLQDVLESGVVAPPQPAGGAEMNSLSQRMESDILFGNRSVDEAVTYWIEYMEEQLAAG